MICTFCKGKGRVIECDSINGATGEITNPRDAECMCCDGTGNRDCLPSSATETAPPSHADDCEPRTLKEWAEALVCETTGRYLDCDIILVDFEQDTAIATKYLTMFSAPLRERIATLEAELKRHEWSSEHMTLLRNAIAATIPKPPVLDSDGKFFSLGDGSLVAWPKRLLERAVKAEAELAALRTWKNEMLAVESQWDDQAVGRELGIPPGTSIRAGILPAIKRLKSEQASIPEKAQRAADDIGKNVDGYAELANVKLPPIDREHMAAILTRIFGEQP